MRKYLVVGARRGSLGEAIFDYFDAASYNVVKADLPDVDIRVPGQVLRLLQREHPTDIVCTAGINLSDDLGEPSITMYNFAKQWEVNAYGPLLLLTAALEMWQGEGMRNFCAVSSNSAHIARSQSMGYCASKAALSMALRCAARRMAGSNVTIWAYEPGWIDGTPMSEEVSKRLEPGTSWHRIPGGHGVDKYALAARIAEDVINPMDSYNGMLFRIDGGEQ